MAFYRSLISVISHLVVISARVGASDSMVPEPQAREMYLLARQTLGATITTTTPSGVLPSLSLPSGFPTTLSFPTLPSFSLDLPSISLPSISWPSVSIPSLSLPSLSIPTAISITVSLPSPPPLFNSTASDDEDGVDVPTVVGSVVGGVLGLGLIGGGILLWLYLRHRKRDSSEELESHSGSDRSPSPDMDAGNDVNDTEKGSRPFNGLRRPSTFPDAGRLPPHKARR